MRPAMQNDSDKTIHSVISQSVRELRISINYINVKKEGEFTYEIYSKVFTSEQN